MLVPQRSPARSRFIYLFCINFNLSFLFEIYFHSFFTYTIIIFCLCLLFVVLVSFFYFWCFFVCETKKLTKALSKERKPMKQQRQQSTTAVLSATDAHDRVAKNKKNPKKKTRQLFASKFQKNYMWRKIKPEEDIYTTMWRGEYFEKITVETLVHHKSKRRTECWKQNEIAKKA